MSWRCKTCKSKVEGFLLKEEWTTYELTKGGNFSKSKNPKKIHEYKEALVFCPKCDTNYDLSELTKYCEWKKG